MDRNTKILIIVVLIITVVLFLPLRLFERTNWDDEKMVISLSDGPDLPMSLWERVRSFDDKIRQADNAIERTVLSNEKRRIIEDYYKRKHGIKKWWWQ